MWKKHERLKTNLHRKKYEECVCSEGNTEKLWKTFMMYARIGGIPKGKFQFFNFLGT